MTQGNQPQTCDATGSRRALFGSIRGLGAAVVLLVTMLSMALAGCGGGSEGRPNPNPSTSPGDSTAATVTGRVVDRYANNGGVAGATVTYGNSVVVTTDATGTFTFTVRAGQGVQTLRVAVPAGSAYYDNASIQGTTYAILSSGAPIRDLTAGETLQLGEIVLSSQNGPPPPPIFP